MFLNRHYMSVARWGICVFLCFLAGCASRTSGVTQTEAKTQIERLFNLYKAYAETKQKAPPNEKALKDFAKGLNEEALQSLMIGNDIESIFISPRDNQPFQVAYGQSISPGGAPIAIIYEKSGLEGRKYAALSIGYAEEYDDASLSEYLPKKK